MAETATPLNQTEYILALIKELNRCTKAYDEGKPLIDDQQWDSLYFELKQLEEETGIIFPNSPTQSISYEVINNLEKVTHNHKMLSLDKTKSVDDILSFIDGRTTVAMCKMDGLTCSLTYKEGQLIRAETRGNGEIGENILHNAKVVKNIPQKIDYFQEVTIDGEIICTYKDFEDVSSEYKHPRNYAAGSIRLLDSQESANRNLTFIAWEMLSDDSLTDKIVKMTNWGFTAVPCRIITLSDDDITTQDIQQLVINSLQYQAESLGYPIDGVVFKYDDTVYGKSLGETSHHAKNAIAFKFYDETYDSHLIDIEWQLSRSGQINPIAVFEEIEIDGTKVNKASLSNLSIIFNTLNMPWKGQCIRVSKRNQVIPHIESADIETIPDDDSLYISTPAACPACGGRVIVRKDNDSEVLYCDNSDCSGKFITALTHFCSKSGIDVKGLSKNTLEKLIDWGWVERFGDIFALAGHREEWIKKSGFGVASVDKILAAVEKASHCDLDAFISAIGIPLVGRSTAKELVKHFPTWKEFRNAVENDYPFYQLAGFGREISQSLINFNYAEARYIAHNFITFTESKTEQKSNTLEGQTIAITGKISHWKNRDELKAYIESLGGKVSSSVSGKTNYLINNDNSSNSGKTRLAKELNIPIITEEEFIDLLSSIQ